VSNRIPECEEAEGKNTVQTIAGITVGAVFRFEVVAQDASSFCRLLMKKMEFFMEISVFGF
jgi:hypothetical protein